MESVLNLIREERERQDAKWGADRQLDDYFWLTIITEELGETAEAILKGWPEEAQKELVQVAAVAVSWLECMARRHLTPAAPDEDKVCQCEALHPVNYKGQCVWCGLPRR
jgi:NTP pyrophosphatase (non-canonical NTP hydrolase)